MTRPRSIQVPLRMIKDQVLSVGTPSKPVVIGTGGCLTTVASAYLLAHREGRGAEFASKCAVYSVAWTGVSKTRFVSITIIKTLGRCTSAFRHCAHTSSPGNGFAHECNNLRPFIDSLPPSPLGDYMKSVRTENFWMQNDGMVGDVSRSWPSCSQIKGNTFSQIYPIAFSHWGRIHGEPIATSMPIDKRLLIRGDPSSNDRLIYSYNQSVSAGILLTQHFNARSQVQRLRQLLRLR